MLEVAAEEAITAWIKYGYLENKLSQHEATCDFSIPTSLVELYSFKFIFISMKISVI
jgi:hypothetical protein